MSPRLWNLAKQNLRPLAVAVLTLALVCACATVPETGRRQLVVTDPATEARMGTQLFDQIKSEQRISTDSAARARVNRVGRRIAAVAPVENAQWEFVVFDDSVPNAFALPGGKIGVNTGILPIARDDAGLATVLAHEVGHVIARHGGERMSQNMFAAVGGALLDVGLAVGAGLSPAERQVALGAYGAGATVGVLLPFSRRHELEADRIGLLLMARAGYDPRAAVGFWQRMMEYSRRQGGANVPEFLRTHPLDERRIAEIESFMPEALAEYRKATGRE